MSNHHLHPEQLLNRKKLRRAQDVVAAAGYGTKPESNNSEWKEMEKEEANLPEEASYYFKKYFVCFPFVLLGGVIAQVSSAYFNAASEEEFETMTFGNYAAVILLSTVVLVGIFVSMRYVAKISSRKLAWIVMLSWTVGYFGGVYKNGAKGLIQHAPGVDSLIPIIWAISVGPYQALVVSFLLHLLKYYVCSLEGDRMDLNVSDYMAMTSYSTFAVVAIYMGQYFINIGASKRAEFFNKKAKMRTVQLEESNAELRKALKDLLAARVQIEEEEVRANVAERTSAAKSRFLSTVSHEVRTPTMSILMLAELLMKDDSLADHAREYISTIRSSTELLLGLLNDLLDFQKIDANMLTLKIAPFDVSSCLEQTVQVLGARAADSRLELIYVIDDDVPVNLVGDCARLTQILVNLVSNSLKFTGQGHVYARIQNGSEKDDKENNVFNLHFSVEDTGIGMDETDIQNIFEPFIQGDGSITKRFKGLGLGLSISRRICSLMGGKIWGSSKGHGKGSTFQCKIPFRIADRGDNKQQRDKVKAYQSVLGGRFVLVGESEVSRKCILKSMQGWGLEPHEYDNYGDALEFLKSELTTLAPTLVAVDVPACSGDADRFRVAEFLAGVASIHEGDTKSILNAVILWPGSGLPPRIRDIPITSVVLRKPVILSAVRRTFCEIFERISADFGSNTKKGGCIAPVSECTVGFVNLDGRSKSRRVLVVDDYKFSQIALHAVLEDLKYEHDIASNGAEAIDACSRTDYGVVLMDYHMPVMDGHTATKHIRELNLSTQPLIVGLTADVSAESCQKGMLAGMDHVLKKPITSAELAKYLPN